MDARKIRLIMHLRKSGIVDTAVLGAVERVPRDFFLPQSFHDQAYEDVALPIGHGQTISQPLTVARMTQELALTPKMKVLEIGTGSGYQTAILARLARRVYTIERHAPLLQLAEERLSALKLRNITAKAGDGTKGWPELAPFERILVTAAGESEPPAQLLDQLGEGGVMIAPLGSSPRDQMVCRITKLAGGGISCTELWPTRFVPLLAEEEDLSATGYRRARWA
jgi:protein-L-isoaspartate(D-aspartate) O-methyltransferase